MFNNSLYTTKFYQISGWLLLLICTVFFGYFANRADFVVIFTAFTLGILGWFLLYKQNLSLTTVFWTGIGLRLTLMFSTPLLSDDYFRFIWDGKMSTMGINPFSFKPIDIYQNLNGGSLSYLFQNLNSPNYYSIYPPLNQWCFYIAGLFDDFYKGILALRVIILGFEVGTFWIIIQLFKRFNINTHKIVNYWLNPLAIIELTGNLHAEGILLFFLLTGYYFLTKGKDFKAGIFLALSFSAKLFSLMFLPLLLLKNGQTRWFKFLFAITSVLIISFIPFFNSSTILHFFESFSLYFQNFEFNGSVFQIVRWVGFQVVNYDIVQTAGPVLSLISLSIILWFSWRNYYKNRKVLIGALLLIITTYLTFTPIVHPWYVLMPLGLSLFTQFRFPIVWSFTVFLSYAFYDNTLNPGLKVFLLFAEYTLVVLLFILDLRQKECKAYFTA